MNSLRYFLPHILALSTNSPFWLGMETGYKSYRAKVFETSPAPTCPDYFASYSEFESYVNLLVKTNCIDNAKKIWWDIRPHPFFPTVEVRICDIPLAGGGVRSRSPRSSRPPACQALQTALAQHRLPPVLDAPLLMENKFRAVRYGLDGKMIDFGKQTEVPVRDLILEYLAVCRRCGGRARLPQRDRVHPHHARTRLRRRPSTAKVFRETGSLRAVVDLHGSRRPEPGYNAGCPPFIAMKRAACSFYPGYPGSASIADPHPTLSIRPMKAWSTQLSG